MNDIKKIAYRRLDDIAADIPGVEIEDRTYNNRDILFKEGDAADGLFFIEHGTILLTTIGIDGSDVVIRTAENNNFIGFLSLIRGTSYTATAIAIEDNCKVRFIAEKIFKEALNHNQFTNGFIEILSDRILSNQGHIVDMQTKNVRQRIATALLSFENAYDKTHDKKEAFISLKKKDIAAIVGITPETLSRRLAEFETEGLIELHIKGLKLINQHKLIRIAELID